jgi:hypothetical protein
MRGRALRTPATCFKDFAKIGAPLLDRGDCTIFNDKSVTAKLRMPSPDSHFFAPLDQHPAGAVKNM